MKITSYILYFVLLGMPSPASAADHRIAIYGGTSAAITATVQAKKLGKPVIIVSPVKRPDDLSSEGLGFTDNGHKAVICGLSREIYHRVWRPYDNADAWKWQKFIRADIDGKLDALETDPAKQHRILNMIPRRTSSPNLAVARTSRLALASARDRCWRTSPSAASPDLRFSTAL